MPEISTTDNGLYLFRFKDMDARDWVMEKGPWYIAGRPIILRVWQPGMEMLNIQLTSLPIWVKFYNIPLEYWTNNPANRDLSERWSFPLTILRPTRDY